MRVLRGYVHSVIHPRSPDGFQQHLCGLTGILPRRSSAAGIGNNVVAQPLAATQHCAQASARTRIIDESTHEAGIRLV